jgi:transcriptional/translational regulatory protein YebC/TACO1
VLLAAADAGADDVRPQDDGRFEVVCDAKDFASVRSGIEASGLQIETAELTMLPQTTIALDAAGAPPVLRLLDALEDLDDVQGVYANFDVSDDVLASLS